LKTLKPKERDMDRTIFFSPPAKGKAMGLAQLRHLLSEAGIPHVADDNSDSFGRYAIYFGGEAEFLPACPTLRVGIENGVIKEGILICQNAGEDRLPEIVDFFARIHWEKNELD
jgi:hypothetical protein